MATFENILAAGNRKPHSHFLQQDSSLFFSALPLEIREMIYKDFIWGAYGRVHFLLSDHNYEGGFKFNPCKGRLRKRGGVLRGVYEDDECCRLGGAHATDLLSLPRTCKRVYMEMIVLLYSIPLFEMNERCFTLMEEKLPPSHFDHITRISITMVFCTDFFKLDWRFLGVDEYIEHRHRGQPAREADAKAWDGICVMLSKMSRLQEVQLWAREMPSDHTFDDHSEHVMLASAQRLSHVRNLSVIFMWTPLWDERKVWLEEEYKVPFSWEIARLLS